SNQPPREYSMEYTPIPDILGRVIQLQADRQAVLTALGAIPQQHDATIAAWVDGMIAEARTADEATIQRLMTALELTRQRQRRTKMDAATFWARHHAMRADWLAQHGRYPTQTEEAAALGISRKTLWEYLHPGAAKKKRPHS